MNEEKRRAYFDSKLPNVFGEYELTIACKDYDAYLAMQKVAYAIMDGKVTRPGNIRIITDKNKEA